MWYVAWLGGGTAEPVGALRQGWWAAQQRVVEPAGACSACTPAAPCCPTLLLVSPPACPPHLRLPPLSRRLLQVPLTSGRSGRALGLTPSPPCTAPHPPHPPHPLQAAASSTPTSGRSGRTSTARRTSGATSGRRTSRMAAEPRRSVNRWIDQPIKQTVKQTNNQSSGQPVGRSDNQPNNTPFHVHGESTGSQQSGCVGSTGLACTTRVCSPFVAWAGGERTASGAGAAPTGYAKRDGLWFVVCVLECAGRCRQGGA